MRRSGKLATIPLVSALFSGCHKQALPAPPPVPAQTERTSPPAPRQRTTPPPGTPASPVPNPTSPSEPAKPDFRLGEALTPEQLRANNALIEAHLEHATKVIESIGNRRLSNEQKTSVAQIRGFIDQARQMRTTDVLRARSLAERADVLAQDLLSRLR